LSHTVGYDPDTLCRDTNGGPATIPNRGRSTTAQIRRGITYPD
jgi:hypothetical protein